jgi:hypothetical protein
VNFYTAVFIFQVSFIFIFPIEYYMPYIYKTFYFALTGVGYLLAGLFLALLRKRKHSAIVFAGMFFPLLAGVNDRPEQARELAKLCHTLRANVNLIRYNEVPGMPFHRPESADVMHFQEILQKAGVNAHVRKSRGRDIDAACGQLRRREAQQAAQLTVSGKSVADIS